MSLPMPSRRRRAAQPPAGDEPMPVRAPGVLKLLLEARAPLELAAMLAASPWLARMPRGDGHPVLVFPGLGAADLTTLPLRLFLRERGYTPYGWELGFNFGPRAGVLEGSSALLARLAAQHGRPVSLIGWSLGGIYAREMAKQQPHDTRCVITLGTPFAGHPRATNAWRFYRMVSGKTAHDATLQQQIRAAPPCPTTSIYSKSDGIVAWQCSLNEAAPNTENIEVPASHIGMGLNPLALLAIADRLAQDPQHWQRFNAAGARRWFFKTAHGSTEQKAA